MHWSLALALALALEEELDTSLERVRDNSITTIAYALHRVVCFSCQCRRLISDLRRQETPSPPGAHSLRSCEMKPPASLPYAAHHPR